MMNKFETDDDEMRLYYTYIKLLLNINNNLMCDVPDKLSVKKFLDEIDNIHGKLGEKSLCKLSKRIKYLCSESVYNRPSVFFLYLLNTRFKDNSFNPDGNIMTSNFDGILKEKKKEEKTEEIDMNSLDIDTIINIELKIKGFYSNIVLHKSMYNSVEINDEYILKLSKELTRAHFYEHFFVWFEDYFKYYLKTMETLLCGDGFIPKTWRYYIALMAVGTMRCEYLFKVLEEMYLDSGGDESWLIFGLDVLPEKLSKISRINNLLAHQPWKIITDDIKELNTKRDPNDTSCWNLSEFMQAALIMVQFHKLAIIVDSLNIKLKKTTCEYMQSINNSESDRRKSEEHNKPNYSIKDNLLKNLEYVIAEEQKEKHNNEVKSISKSNYSEDQGDHENFKIDLESLTNDKTCAFDKHVNKYCNIYHDFDAHGDQFRSYLEFNWSDQGYYILQNLFPKGVDCLNDEIEYISSFTNNSLGEENRQLDTFPIRYAISCYIEKILGYYHEDYDYANVNRLLVVNYKKFIKNVACYPQRLSQEDFNLMSYAFNNEEILHIILLVATVKSRTQLTYLASSLYEIIKNID